MSDFRIGHGYDVHTFTDGDHIVLGGEIIPHGKAFKAHSDGDVLIHAICDALLGALALGDIGQHFPDTDARYKDANSRDLLVHVIGLVSEKNFKVANVDTTIIAQMPKLSPHIKSMQTNLSEDLQIDSSRVNIKATTTEGLGFAGREEGIAAHAVVLLVNI